jgi:DNA repair ATPase RecN
MKKLVVLLGFILFTGFKSQAQVYELERLVLDIEKLAQLKNILTDLYKAYEILSSGYSAIKGISEGNFNLHKAFLDGLLAVSPAVQKYARVVDIVEDQGKILSEYKAAYHVFSINPHFSPDELAYLSSVYNTLIEKSERNLENLLNIMTASKLRMNDAERLEAIDRLYADTHGQLSFLRQFNSKTGSIARERSKAASDIQSVQSLYGIK